MNFHNLDDTIIALSTPQSSSALAVMRLSGSFQVTDFKRFIRFSGPIEPRKMKRCQILDENARIIEDGLLCYFPAPHSYNGQDILELHLHGNPFLLSFIIELFCQNLAIRPARPGEFSYRAFANKKLAFNQLEGLKSLLDAQSIYAVHQAHGLLSGHLTEELEKLHDQILNHRAHLELSIDFSVDVGDEQSRQLILDSYQQVMSTISVLNRRAQIESHQVLSPQIVLYGETNSGKSTLFNRLLAHDRAIVSDIAGTTRDYLSSSLRIERNEYQLFDTAGIRQTDDAIEWAGIEKVVGLLKSPFCRVLVCRADQLVNLSSLPYLADFPPDLCLVTHTDLHKLQFMLLTEFEFPCLDVHRDDFISSFEHFIHQRFTRITSSEPLIIERHRQLCQKIHQLWIDYGDLLHEQQDIAIIASELAIVLDHLAELIGNESADDVLQHLFSSFCIGK